MSKTTDFIENQIDQLNSDINILNQNKDEYNRNITRADAVIISLQSQIDNFNLELQKIQITDAQLTTIQAGVLSAQP